MQSSCPRCRSDSSVRGKLELSGTDSGWPTFFFPEGIRLLTLSKSVSLANGQTFQACKMCGLVWSEVDTQELTSLLDKNGTSRASAASDKG